MKSSFASVVSLALFAIAWSETPAAELPRLALAPTTNGMLRLTTTGVGGDLVVVEQSRALGDSNGLSFAPVAVGGTVRANATQRFYRLRVVPPSVPSDMDGDGFPDTAETALGSDPADPASTPIRSLASQYGVIMAGQHNVFVVRPALGARHEVGPGGVVSAPMSVRAVRPEMTAASSLANGPHIASPQSIRVRRQ